MKYAIIENENQSLNHIKAMLHDLRPDWELMFTADTVAETVAALTRAELPDLLFLDIELNDGNSFSIFKRVEVNIPVIFTTAYDEYCLQAFKVNSLDYIMKPITVDSLLFAIRKFESLRDSSNPFTPRYDALEPPAHEGHDRQVRILISYRDTYRFITCDNVAWFESEDKCVFAVDKEGVRHLTTFSTLGEVEALLDSRRFFRASRSSIVSIDAITDVKKSFNYKLYVLVKAGSSTQKIDISQARKKIFLTWFGHGKV